jgi:rRNA maturation protein Nop10
MNRAGRYTIEATATCRHCGKTSQINYGIRVMPLE